MSQRSTAKIDSQMNSSDEQSKLQETNQRHAADAGPRIFADRTPRARPGTRRTTDTKSSTGKVSKGPRAPENREEQERRKKHTLKNE